MRVTFVHRVIVRLTLTCFAAGLALLATMLLLGGPGAYRVEAAGASPPVAGEPSGRRPANLTTTIAISSRQILLDSHPFQIKGVGYAPTPDRQ